MGMQVTRTSGQVDDDFGLSWIGCDRCGYPIAHEVECPRCQLQKRERTESGGVKLSVPVCRWFTYPVEGDDGSLEIIFRGYVVACYARGEWREYAPGPKAGAQRWYGAVFDDLDQSD